MIEKYNKYIEGLEHYDWLLEKYCIAIKEKKWY